jgi:hypothetical protein
VNILKHIWLTLVQRVKQICALPESVAKASQQRKRQAGLDELEAERLDRIRNPSKYLGK